MKFDFSDLVASGLVKEKVYPNGLRIYKYARKVFYDRLWEVDKRLLEARGIVLDESGEAVVWPFTKVFNYLEYNAGAELWKDTQIVAPRKVNGFLCAARIYKGELVVSTTGSLDSDFVVLARTHIEKLNVSKMRPILTYLFEICDPSDPHIVEEEEGAYLIGARRMGGSHPMAHECQLDDLAVEIGAKRPEVFYGTFGALWEMVKDCKHEGWMVIDAETGNTVMKIKSPHYLAKKFLMRMGNKKVDQMFDNKQEFLKTIDEEFYAIVHYITRWWDADKWKETDEAARRAIIEKYFEKEAQ